MKNLLKTRTNKPLVSHNPRNLTLTTNGGTCSSGSVLMAKMKYRTNPWTQATMMRPLPSKSIQMPLTLNRTRSTMSSQVQCIRPNPGMSGLTFLSGLPMMNRSLWIKRHIRWRQSLIRSGWKRGRSWTFFSE